MTGPAARLVAGRGGPPETEQTFAVTGSPGRGRDRQQGGRVGAQTRDRGEATCRAMSLSGRGGGLRLSFAGARRRAGARAERRVRPRQRARDRALPAAPPGAVLLQDPPPGARPRPRRAGRLVASWGSWCRSSARLHEHRRELLHHAAGRLGAPHDRPGRAAQPGAGLRVARRRARRPRPRALPLIPPPFELAPFAPVAMSRPARVLDAAPRPAARRHAGDAARGGGDVS